MKATWSSLALCLIPLAVGGALLFALPQLRSLTQLEHALFWFPKSDDSLIEREPLHEFRVQVSDISPADSAKIATPRVLTSTGEESATDWLFALNALRTHGAEKITLSPLLSWDDSDELELRTLDHEITSFSSAATGLTLRLDSTAQPFPNYLADSVIPAANYQADLTLLPEVNAITSAPSTSAGLFGFRLLENAQPQIQSTTITVPLLARWGDSLLPSLELASLIVHSGHQPSDVRISKKGQLRIGKKGPVIPLDPQGQINLPRLSDTGETTLLQSLSDPDQQNSPAQVVILSENAPPHLQQLAHSLAQLGSRLPRDPITFTRPPYWIEITILLLLALFLSSRAALAFLLLPLAPFLARNYQQWLLLTPALALLLTFFILRAKLGKSAPSTQKPAPAKKATPPPAPKKKRAQKKTTRKRGKKKKRKR